MATLRSTISHLSSLIKIVGLAIIICTSPSYSHAQNYFANPDFEEYNLCIEYQQLCSAAAWFYIQPAATPLINLKMVPQPFNGRDLLLVPVENVFTKVAKRAFVYTKFCCPLQKGKNYKLTFYIHTGGKKFYGIDFYFRKKEFLSNNFFADSIQPSIRIAIHDSLLKINEWNYVETFYTATGDERFCLVGNLSKSAFDFKPNARMNKAGDIFYFIDNISFSSVLPEKNL